MPSPFAITAATSTVSLDAARQGTVSMTVSNTGDTSLTGRAELAVDDLLAEEWFHLAGDAERDFLPDGTEHYTVGIAVPAGASAGSFTFRLDMVGVDEPDEIYTAGPTITVEAPAPATKEPFPWWIVAAAAGVLLVLTIILTAVLWPRKVEVPGVADLPSNAAVATLVALDFKVDTETVAHEQVGLDQAVESQPPSGTRLKRGSQVMLFVSSGPPLVKVPQVIDELSADALVLLERTGLQAELQEVSHATIESDRVTRADPQEGSQVEPGSLVTLFVSSGPPLVQVPQVFGELSADAVAILERSGLQAELQEVSHATIKSDRVTRAEPQEGSQVEPGSLVTLSVSSGLSDVIIRNVTGWPAEDASTALLNLGLRVEEVRAFDDRVEAGHIIRVDPAPGNPVAPQTVVTLEISDGPEAAQVPDLYGWPLQLARVQLEVLCEPHPCVEVVPDVVEWGGLSPLSVYSSDPPVGTPIARGTRIVLHTEEWEQGGSEAVARCMEWEYVPRRLVAQDGTPDVAEIGEVRSDGREWILQIVDRVGYTWVPAAMATYVMLDADQIARTLDLQRNKIDYYQGVEIRGDKTISILLKQENPDFVEQLSKVILLSNK